MSMPAWVIAVVSRSFHAFNERILAMLHMRRTGTRMHNGHRAALGLVYLAIAALIVLVFVRLGNGMRTRSLPAGSVSVSSDYSQYLVGETVKFTITNAYNAPMYITNNCPSEPLDVYRWEESKWVRIHDTKDPSLCPAGDRQVKIPASSSLSSSFAGWNNLFAKPGKYRIVVYVDYYGSLPYADFEVIDKPAVPAIPELLPPKTATAPVSTPSSGGSTTTTQQPARNDDNDEHESAPPTPSQGSSGTTTLPSKTLSLSQGTIVAEYSGTTIYLKSVTPAAGYTYEKNRSQGTTIEVTFKKSGSEVQIKLYLSGGELKYKLED